MNALSNPQSYGNSALDAELAAMRSTGDGGRANQLFKSAAAIAGLEAANVPMDPHARHLLIEAAKGTGLDEREIDGHVKRGWEAGRASPRAIELRPSPASANDRPASAGAALNTGTYVYDDGAGQPLYRTRRVEQPGRDKRFVAERWQDGEWVGGIGDVQRVPYRLTELRSATPGPAVYLVEGERKADKLASWGLIATAVAFGASGWRDEYAAELAGRPVIILPDNDEAGAKFAAKAKASIEAAGGTSTTVELPGLPHKGDIMDWTGTPDELAALVAKAGDTPAVPMQGLVGTRGINARDLMSKTFDPIRYIVPGYVAEGLTVFAGAPKIGKSWMALGLGLSVASGGTALGSIQCEQGDVLYLALEDNPRRLQKRMRQMRRFDVPDRLTFVFDWPALDDGGLGEIERWLINTPGARLVIIDVFAKVKGGDRGGREKPQYEADYAAAAGLQKLAGEFGVAILLVHHTRKMEADDPFDAVSGTRGLTGAADTVLVLKKDGGTQKPTLYGRGRDIEEIESAMQFDGETGTWSILGDAAEIAKTSERQEVLDVLKAAGEPMKAAAVAEELGKSRSNISHLISRMVREGKVERTGTLYTPVTPFTAFTDEGGPVNGVNAPTATVHKSSDTNPPYSEDCERRERCERFPPPPSEDDIMWDADREEAGE